MVAHPSYDPQASRLVAQFERLDYIVTAQGGPAA